MPCRERRLRRPKDFERVFRDGRSVGGKLLAVRWARVAGDARVAFVAGSRVGKAVARNRAKRLLREAYRRTACRLTGGHDLVIIARPGIAGKALREVEDALLELLDRGKLIERDQQRGPRAD